MLDALNSHGPATPAPARRILSLSPHKTAQLVDIHFPASEFAHGRYIRTGSVAILQWRLPLWVRGHGGPARSMPLFRCRFPTAHHHKHRVVALDVVVCSPATRGAQRDHDSTITGTTGANLFEV